jgi:hypothetical protein
MMQTIDLDYVNDRFECYKSFIYNAQINGLHHSYGFYSSL